MAIALNTSKRNKSDFYTYFLNYELQLRSYKTAI
nr:MAG TPA: hypothetical protein [Caudoviricetes sp.]